MEWNVYIHNINQNKIEVYNIFEHGSFIEDLRKLVWNAKVKTCSLKKSSQN